MVRVPPGEATGSALATERLHCWPSADGTSISTGQPRDDELSEGRWERAWGHFDRWGSLGLLGLSTLLSIFSPELAGSERLVIVGLVGVAGAWVTTMDVAAPQWLRGRVWHPPVLLVGVLALSFLLMRQDPVFFIFAIAGFFHAARLRPRALVFVGVGATSLLINTLTWGGLPRPTLEENLGFAALVAIQTVLISAGMIGAERLSDHNEERARTVRRLEWTLAENEQLHDQLVTRARDLGVQEERQRLAREIHDTLAQGFVGIIAQLEAAKQTADDEAAQQRHLATALDLARHSLAEARRSVHALGPSALDRGRLLDALHDMAHRWTEVYGVAVEVSAEGPHARLPTPVEVALLGVTQEALNNIAKHAHATRVAVGLSVLDDRVLLDVRDDGRGFEPDGDPADSDGYGLRTMRQRVESLAGRCTIESHPGGGTAISVEAPLEPAP